MNVKTTLNFFGRTEEAIDFYRHAIGAETDLIMRFRDSPDQSNMRPGMEDKVFHATFRIGDTVLMASDVGCFESQHNRGFDGFALALRVDTAAEAERCFTSLSEGGEILIPLAESVFTSRYGIVIDRFGISWKVMVE